MNYCFAATVFAPSVSHLRGIRSCAKIFPHFRNRPERKHTRDAQETISMLHYHIFRLSRMIRQENVSFKVI